MDNGWIVNTIIKRELFHTVYRLVWIASSHCDKVFLDARSEIEPPTQSRSWHSLWSMECMPGTGQNVLVDIKCGCHRFELALLLGNGREEEWHHE
mmetsp:Transcript_19271/g.29242  ORF Transcript_19271/g.29242 Transcript_19271/m.29242 type:complete len:95 (-) Transcript_19271:70-354(-)